jgi:hypothetical protein
VGTRRVHRVPRRSDAASNFNGDRRRASPVPGVESARAGTRPGTSPWASRTIPSPTPARRARLSGSNSTAHVGTRPTTSRGASERRQGQLPPKARHSSSRFNQCPGEHSLDRITRGQRLTPSPTPARRARPASFDGPTWALGPPHHPGPGTTPESKSPRRTTPRRLPHSRATVSSRRRSPAQPAAEPGPQLSCANPASSSKQRLWAVTRLPGTQPGSRSCSRALGAFHVKHRYCAVLLVSYVISDV